MGPGQVCILQEWMDQTGFAVVGTAVPEAVVTISYEAQARLQDPVYGCVAHIFSLQQQVY